jgi:hypothetical protein
VQFSFRHLAFPFIEHLHIAAERYGGNREFGLIRAELTPPCDAPKANGET